MGCQQQYQPSSLPPPPLPIKILQATNVSDVYSRKSQKEPCSLRDIQQRIRDLISILQTQQEDEQLLLSLVETDDEERYAATQLRNRVEAARLNQPGVMKELHRLREQLEALKNVQKAKGVPSKQVHSLY